MKTIKYITTAVLCAIILIFSAESGIMYTINYAFQLNNIYYTVEFTDEDTYKNSLADIKNTADQKDVIVCVTNSNISKASTDLAVYSNASESQLKDSLKVSIGEYKSLIYRKASIKCSSFEQLPYNQSQDILVYGSDKNIHSFANYLKENYDISGGVVFSQNRGLTFFIIVYAAWILLIFFVFFMSYFVVIAKKRELFIKEVNGESPSKIVFSNIFSDIAINIAIFLCVDLILSRFSTFELTPAYTVLIIALIIFSFIPFLSLFKFNYSVVVNEGSTIGKVLTFSYIYKALLTAMTVVAITFTVTNASQLVSQVKNYKLAKQYSDSSVCSIQADTSIIDESIDGYDKFIENTKLACEEVYRKFYETNNALIINKYNEKNYIYCNSNAKNYVEKQFKNYTSQMNDADVYCFISSKSTASAESIQKETEFIVNQCEGKSWQPNIKYITYDENIECIYFENDDKLIGTVENPYLIFCSKTPQEIGVDISEPNRASFTVLYNLDENMTNYLNSQQQLTIELESIKETYESNYTQYTNFSLGLLIISLTFIILSLFVSCFIIKLEYRINAKPYCIKKILGYPIISKFGSNLWILIVSSLIGAAIGIVVFRDNTAYILLVLCICLIQIVVDGIITIYYAVKIENNNIVKCLKDGAI